MFALSDCFLRLISMLMFSNKNRIPGAMNVQHSKLFAFSELTARIQLIRDF